MLQLFRVSGCLVGWNRSLSFLWLNADIEKGAHASDGFQNKFFEPFRWVDEPLTDQLAYLLLSSTVIGTQHETFGNLEKREIYLFSLLLNNYLFHRLFFKIKYLLKTVNMRIDPPALCFPNNLVTQ